MAYLSAMDALGDPTRGARLARVAPLQKPLTIECGVDRAFLVFTEEIATWWPTSSHSIGGDKVETVVFEGRVDGRVYERQTDGTKGEWGRVLVWEPPHRLPLGFAGGHQPPAG